MNRLRPKQAKNTNYQKKFELASHVQATPEDLFSHLDPKSIRETDLHTFILREESTIAATSGGVATAVINQNPSTSSNWASYAGCFDEYRVLAMKVEMIPNHLSGGGSQSIQAPVVAVVDLDNNAPLTGYSVANFYSSSKEVNGGTRLKILGLMSGSENSVFQSTASPSTLWYIKFYSSGNSASLPLGQLRITRWVQFRGQGL